VLNGVVNVDVGRKFMVYTVHFICVLSVQMWMYILKWVYTCVNAVCFTIVLS